MARVTSTNKVYYEALISESPKGQFYMTLVISHQGSFWTSEPARLFVSDIEAAHTEGKRQMETLAKAIRGEVEP